MKNYILPLLLAAFSLSLLAQKPLSIKGTISNFPNKTLNISLYPNWASPSHEFYFETDENGRFEFSQPVNEYAYINLNIGKYGYLFWLVKGGDGVYLLMDYNNPDSTFFTSGTGASKWNYQHSVYEQFEKVSDIEYEVNQARNYSFEDYSFVVDSLFDVQNKFLEKSKDKLLGEFFLLQKAELIGKKNRWLTSYALSNKLPKASVFSDLEFYSVSPERQALSFEFNRFFDLYIDLEKRESDFEARSLSEEISFIKNLFLYGKMERPIAELKVHQRMVDFVNNHVFTNEMEKGYELYKGFVRNEGFKKIVDKEVERRRRFQQGFEANELVVAGEEKSLKLKDLKKKNTLIYVFDKSCIICEEDFEYFEMVQNNFDKKKKVNVVLVQNASSDEMMEIPSHNFDIYQSAKENSFNRYFGVREVPQVYLINNEGMIFGDLPAPSDDGGRNLIKGLRSIIGEDE